MTSIRTGTGETMYERELEIATQLAHRAGLQALADSETGVDVQEKGPDDLVTNVDRALNTFIVEALQSAFPGDAVVAEESQDNSRRARRTWFVDPIDGTKDFVNRTGQWSVMIGLAIAGRPVVGVVYQPTEDRMYAAAQGLGGSLRMGSELRPLRCSTRRAAADLIMVRSANHPDRFSGLLAARAGVSQSYAHGSLGCKLVQIAEGRADLYGNGSGKVSLWDTCAGEAILAEAGGSLRRADGSLIRYDAEETIIRVPFAAWNHAAVPAWWEGADALL